MKRTMARVAGLVWLGGVWLGSLTQAAFDPNDRLTGLVYAHSNYLAVGYWERYDGSTGFPIYGGVGYASLDGTNWVRRTNNLSRMDGIAYGNGMLVAYASHWEYNNSIWRPVNYLQTSTDGTNWARQNLSLPGRINRLRFLHDRFVGVGEVGTLLTSPDGLNWSYPSSQTEYDLYDVAYGNGQFVAVGDRGAVLTSADGRLWTNQFAGVIDWLGGIAFENGRFLAVCRSWQERPYLRVFASADGATWSDVPQDPALNYSYYYYPILFSGNGWFLVPGDSNSLLVSSNGTQWTIGNLGVSYLNEVAFQGGRFWGLLPGAILTSADGLSWFNLALENAPPTITSGPSTLELLVGESFTLYLNVSGNPSPHCRWQFNGADLPGAGSPNLYFWNTATNQAGEYRLIASNAWGTATSEVHTILVSQQPPVFLNVLSNVTVRADEQVRLSAEARAGPPPAYQWFFQDQALPGATNATLELPLVSVGHAGNYYVVASNALGVVTSRVATLFVNTQPPTITRQPTNLTVAAGAKALFSATAGGAPAPQYHLYFNGASLALPVRYGGSFAILETTTNDAGAYFIVASNLAGTATSRVFQVSLRPPEPLEIWRRRNPIPQGNHLLSVTYGAGQLVAVGEQGAMLASTNATNWVLQSLRTDVQLAKVVYGNGQFIAVGENGNILGSTDGQTWNLRRIEDINLKFRSVTFGNGRFVAVGAKVNWWFFNNGETYASPVSAVIWTSTDGLEWTACSLSKEVIEFTDVAWGNDRFVALSGRRYVAVSLDGVDWDIQNLGDYGDTTCLTYGKGRFVAMGNDGLAAISGDGYSWTLRTFGSARRFLGVAYGNNLFVGVGTRGTIYTSPDGLTWTVRDSTTSDRLEGVTYANQLFVAVGENGTTLTSPDGITWRNQTLGCVRDLDGLTLGDGQLVIAGKYGTILTSPDGLHWTPQTTGVTNDLHGVAFADGQYVAVGEQGTILLSSNAVAWTRVDSGETNANLKRVARGGSVWVAVGTGGTILTSPDALNWWRALTPTADDLNEVAYGNGVFVVVGDHFPRNATILTSSNALEWRHQVYFTGKNVRAITFANGFFLATGNDGVIAVSTNGTQWSSRYSGVGYDGANLRSVHYTNGLWIVVGNDGIILTSTNTYQWTMRAANTIENLHGVQFFNGSFVTIGNRGNIFQSGRLFGPALAARAYDPATGFRLAIQAQLGYPQRLQVSTNLSEWTDLLLLGDTEAVTHYVDEAAPAQARRFYRVVSP